MVFTTLPPIAISPPVISSSPAIMRSSVDLPQPDGPTSTANSPSAISMSTPRITCVPPKYFWTFRICTDAIVSLLSPFDHHVPRTAGGRPIDQVLRGLPPQLTLALHRV